MDIVAQAEAREEQARSCFASHDLDGSGNIDARELLYALMDLGLKHADEDVASFKTLVERCMKEHDANADGVLSWTEFQQMYNAVSGVRSEARRGAHTSPATLYPRPKPRTLNPKTLAPLHGPLLINTLDQSLARTNASETLALCQNPLSPKP
jgi:hypothetical protein